MMSTEAKREYQRIWRMKKRAEKEVHAAIVLKKQQANAAKARAAKQARNGKPVTLRDDNMEALLSLPVPARWSMTDGKNIIDLGVSREGIVVAIDGRTVVNLSINQ